MLQSISTRILGILAVAAFLSLSVLLSQTSSPSPSPSPDASPTLSPSPSPARAPSPTPLPGAQNFHQWGSVTVFNGLPSDSVRAIAQTPDGVMWFGTDNGLARFDGRRVQNFSPGGAETNRVRALKTTPSGELWVGTGGGAFVYSGNRFQPVAGTENIGVTAILLGREVFLGTDTGLVLRVVTSTGGTLSAVRMFADPMLAGDDSPLNITGLIESEGRVLASTSGRGIFVVDDGAVSEFPSAPRPLFVNSLAQSNDEKLWFASDAARNLSGAYVADGESRIVRVAAPTGNILSLESNESGLWAGSERFGLFHFVGPKLKKNYTFENTSGGLRSNTIFILFTDREGVVWVGTNRGASRFDRLGASQETVSDIPNSNFIRTLFQAADGTIYAGSNRGLFVKRLDEWAPVAAYGNRPVFALGEDRFKKLLVGTTERNPASQNQGIENIDTRSYADFQGRKYAAVFGLGLVEMGSGIVRHPDPSINSLCASGEKLFIGTVDSGLFSFDGQTVRPEISNDLLKSGTIWKMFSGTDGDLWIAGQHGVFRLRDGQAEKIIDAEDVRDVLADRDEIWAATTTLGLLHARHDERFGWLVSSVAFEQGLPSEKAFSIMPVADGLLIATNRGVVTYKPGSVAPKLIATRVLTQRLHDLSELASTVALEYPQNSLLVEVAGQSSRTFPEEFQYGFVLMNAKGESLDKRISNEPQYAAADLDPGEYTIEAIAFNRDLLASEPLTVRFSVADAPFPWTATALGVLLVMALVALAWAIFEHRRIRQRNRELAEARLDLANEAERERSRIARDLHDQTLADLRSLMMTTDKLPGAGATVREEIESISTDIRRICEDLSPSVLENVGLVAALEFLLDRTVQSKSFVADDAVERDTDFPLHVQLQIYRIAQEVLANIARHSDADSVEMNVDMPNGDFVLTVRDNGTTFQPDGSPVSGRGISNIRARANLIHGRVAWKESRRGGNVFSLKIAAGNGKEN